MLRNYRKYSKKKQASTLTRRNSTLKCSAKRCPAVPAAKNSSNSIRELLKDHLDAAQCWLCPRTLPLIDIPPRICARAGYDKCVYDVDGDDEDDEDDDDGDDADADDDISDRNITLIVEQLHF